MPAPSAQASGTFSIGGDLALHRLGFGATPITGASIWGEPADRDASWPRCARRASSAPTLIDTADSYGPFVSEDLLREALHPYDDLVVAIKGALTRHGPGIWKVVGRPEYLRQCVMLSLRGVKVERIALWQFHRNDPAVPRDEQFGIMAEMQKEGLIRLTENVAAAMTLSGADVEALDILSRKAGGR